ncbi:DNA polymerase III alpha subunit [Caulobacter phage C1]|nr:DNA polymerase III alpha subunit [Caulobacter phage C1]UTU08407.1 DNA polymerase III alpha subunit [Caulobacter phage C2]UTU08924.1 DNA polymerase III alpha subunit [Caulobacter phage J4]UTU09480.1 DNA polymerase III alpha subunit [Caulobacter phage BL47]UTU10040.1 DNA polymerase III alpha subunit [Caulobacter phage RB23]WGN97075.1 DNA polymerase III alpha subunit [Bertelyvirus sp.]
MILFFDTETTGLWNKGLPMGSEEQPKIVQIAAILTDENGEEKMQMNFIVRQDHVPQRASDVHGITTEVSQALGLNEGIVMSAFEELLTLADTVVAHNGEYDQQVIQNAYTLLDGKLSNHFADKKAFCTMKASTAICKIKGPRGYKWPKLIEAHEILLGEKFDGAHDALADVRACKRVYFKLQDIINERRAAQGG